MRQITVHELLRSLARHIKERRKELGLSQEMLAEHAGLSSNYVARIEIADKTPSLATLVSLANALEVSVGELLSEDVECGSILDRLDERNREFALRQFRELVDYLQDSQEK